MERWKGSWLWAVAAAAGLALVMVAVMLSSGGRAPTVSAQENTSTPTNTATPVNTATATPVCDLDITKDISDSSVPEDGTADYTITVTNNGDSSCTPDIRVSDVIPSDTDCSDASVDDSSDISSDDVDITGCNSSGTVKWTTSTNLGHDDQLILDLSLDLTSGASDGDHITNEACITEPSDLGCDSARLTVSGATSTPTTAPTATPGTPAPTVVVPTARPVIVPTAGAVAPTLSVPLTGTGPSSGGGSSPWALGLGLLGGVLLLASGVVFVKRTR